MDGEYTDSELESMREKAAEEAYEMHRRATPPRSKKRPADFGRKFFDGEYHAMGGEAPEQTFAGFGAMPAPEETIGVKGRRGGMFGLQQSNDTVFIMSIIMLLMNEKADFMLIFALLYILM